MAQQTTIELFNAPCGMAFQPTKAFLIVADSVSLDWEINVTAAPSLVEWYLEFASGSPLDSNTKWYREVAEEDGGLGVTFMPKVLRRFTENGVNTGLGAGLNFLSAQLIRKHRFVRLQVRCSTGAATVKVITPFGISVA